MKVFINKRNRIGGGLIVAAAELLQYSQAGRIRGRQGQGTAAVDEKGCGIMITEVKMYRAMCDKCGYKDWFWDDKDFALQEALAGDWKEIDGRLLCPDCYEYEKKKKGMRRIYTQCHSFEEADSIGQYIMSKGYEGVQNDSYRYCKEAIRWAFKENNRHHRDYCFIGVNDYNLVVGTNRREMRRKGSLSYVRKVRVFKEIVLSVWPTCRQEKKGGVE